MNARDEQNRLHAEDRPAVTSPDGSWAWYHHGKINRIDGPAVRLVFADGRIEEQFWLNGAEVIIPKNNP